jgi:hypothetical protein
MARTLQIGACNCPECSRGETVLHRPWLLAALEHRQYPSRDDFDLVESDAEVGATLVSVYRHAIGLAELAEVSGDPLRPEELGELEAAVAFQEANGLARLSQSAAKCLAPVLRTARRALAQLVGGTINPQRAAVLLQEAVEDIGSRGGLVDPLRLQYSAYEWSRLARTEMAFAQAAATRATMELRDTDFDALDTLGAVPPIHPNCMCTIGETEVHGRIVAVLLPAPSACELCLDTAASVARHAGVP